MASDDMHVIMYKILSYLYACMKAGERPARERYAWDGALNIPESYWSHIMSELVEHRYISGITIVKVSGAIIARGSEPAITMEGVEFLQQNSMMRRAMEFLKDTKSEVPFI